MTSRPGLVDLAAERLGGKALLANDEFFAPKENLLQPGRGVFIEGRYTSHGAWMDGWETRRRREPGHDWCIVRLAVQGVIRALTVDTNHFKGNHPEACSLDAAYAARPIALKRLGELEREWIEILPQSPLRGHAENQFEVASDARATHVRLNIYPDGGVARLRVWGEARPDWTRLASGKRLVDLGAARHGGVVLASSDGFFGEPGHLILPGRPVNMGDGWETRRRRGPGHDWAVLRLGVRGVIESVEVDTTHFKGNFPESCSLEGCDAGGTACREPPPEGTEWWQVLPRTTLKAHTRHGFRPAERRPATHVRFNIYPDGGVARLRLLGRPAGLG
ncbi:MAG: allantoicase [Gemmatimonadetes bacterium]|nr:allantoicase [Gemmatimonadota bacterium]